MRSANEIQRLWKADPAGHVPFNARSMMRMAIVMRVQHLEHMSAELEHSHHYLLSVTSPHSNRRGLPAASPHIIVVCHVDVKDQFFLLSLESSQLHCTVLTGLQIQNAPQFLKELPMSTRTEK